MPLIIILFFASGATALVYEVAWSKYLGFMFGSTIQAQTVVLAVFMGGLALGNTLLSKCADLLKRPLAAYGLLEVLLGVYGFSFDHLFQLFDGLFISVGSKIIDSPNLLLLWKAFLSTILLGIPTVLMGGTLPLLASWLSHHSSDPKRMSARFYSINTLGAVAGTTIAGFFLIQQLGLPETLKTTAFVNIGVGLISMLLGFRQEVDVSERVLSPATDPAAEPSGSLSLWKPRSMAVLVMVIGAVSMGLEVLASRTLALIFGGSLQSFALVLIAFILGIGLGASVVSSRYFSRFKPLNVILFCLMGAAVSLSLLVLSVQEWAVIYSQLKFGLASNPRGYFLDRLVVALISILVLGIPAGLLGSILPMAIRVSSGSVGLGKQTGVLLTWNTVGAVIGVIVTGFVLMPNLGLPGSFALMAAILGLITFFLATRNRFRGLQAGAAIVVVLTAFTAFVSGDRWRNVLNSGLFRIRNEITHQRLESRQRETTVLYHKDAADASVAVERPDKRGNETLLRVNGKADASAYGDLGTQFLLAHLPFAMRPDSKQVFVFGLGSGITAGALLGHPLQQLTIAENCKPILEAATYFSQWNRGVLTNSRVRLFREDARTVFKLHPQKYDLIVAEPSNPWVAGNASVFSADFYQLALSRLNKGGLMAQWFHVYEMSDSIVFSVIRTFNSVFPYMEIWDSQAGDIILVGSTEPWESNDKIYSSVFARPQPQSDLEALGIHSPVELWARQLASQANAFALAPSGRIQTDHHPFLEYLAPLAFFMGNRAETLGMLDERTMQLPLMSRDKREALEKLPRTSVIKTFSRHSTSNPELAIYLQFLGERQEMEDFVSFQPHLAIPCVFEKEYPVPGSIGMNKLEAARQILLNETNSWKEAVNDIEFVLRQTKSKSKVWTKADRRYLQYFWTVAAVARWKYEGSEGAKKAVEFGRDLLKDTLSVDFFERVAAGINPVYITGSSKQTPAEEAPSQFSPQ